MADWSLPTVTSDYTDFPTELKDRDLDCAKGLDPAVVTVTNPSTNMIRWNSASAKWQKYNGSTWADLTATYAIDISGTAGAVDWTDVTSTPTTLAGYGITDAQPLDSDLTAVAGLSTTGLVVRTGSGTATTRSLTAPAAGLTISNSDGVSGSPTFALANDLLALESLSSTGIAVRSGASTWVQRSIAQPAAGITVSNADGVSGNPTLALANDLSALEGLSSTGIAVRSSTDTWVQRTLTGPAAGITVSNGNGVSGNPTLALANDLSALEGLGSTGIAVRTAADTWVQRTIAASGTGTSITNGDGVSGNPTVVAEGFSTGDVKLTFKSSADTGWVMMDDGSIGSASSGATTRANADTEDLYTVLWTNISDTWAPVSGGRGASAAADFAADKTLTLPKALGRALAVAGAGASLTSRALGENLGEEDHLLTGAESGTEAHGHTASGTTVSRQWATPGLKEAGTLGRAMEYGATGDGGANSTITTSVTVNNASASDASTAHNNMQPSSFFNVMVKL